MMMFRYLLVLLLAFLASCQSTSQDTLFKSLTAEESGIHFENKVENTPEMNIFNYRNFYNGAGVAVGDVNNDGLSDVFLIANQGENKLYLNKGNMHFEDVTPQAGVAGTHAYSTGAVMADVNGDGKLDIYVCNSGEMKGDTRANELFINATGSDGKIKFEEKAAEYGLDDKGYSTHAAFFDYDRDGDLDMFLLQNSSYPVNKLGYQNIRNTRDPLAGQKLFRNDSSPNKSPHFVDVSEQAGIYGSLIGFGLGITIGDVNNDLYPDIYISNDFYERDYLYINQKNGRFVESSKEQMGHISLSSMGADIADINNDENLDIFSTDMLPWDDYRLKTTMTYEDYNLTNLKLQNDLYYQYSRNMLQLNNGDDTFSEVGCLAGVHATDWSWGALIFDMDNDGQKDIFVANGIYKNVTSQDFVQFLNDENTMAPFMRGEKKFDMREFVDKMEAVPIPNYAFKNNGNLQFKNQAKEWGLDLAGFSSGAAYGDLDNDGDLDLIINNTNQPVSVLKNQTVEKTNSNFLRVKLTGNKLNTFGIGTRVKLYQNGQAQVLEQMPNRGFESSCDYTLVFGLGDKPKIDSVVVVWSDSKKQVLLNPTPNKTLGLNYVAANLIEQVEAKPSTTPFVDITAQSKLDFTHQENNFVDYDRDPLLKQMYSRLGPALATADVNADGLEDVFVGASNGNLKKLFLQQTNGTFTEYSTASLNIDLSAEVVGATFFDADGDKDLDLLMVTGSNEYYQQDMFSADYLFLNDGKGNFMKDMRFPTIASSGSCATVADYDADGDMDIFVGGRLLPTEYGKTPQHQLYQNQGNGTFRVSQSIIVDTEKIGMITDAVWADLNQDRYPELLLTCDWGGIVVVQNDRGKRFSFVEIENTGGWWNRIHAVDLDKDGDQDFVVGNLGRNSRLCATEKTPAEMYVFDPENNGRTDQIMNIMAEDGKLYPFITKTDLQKQIPSIKKKYVYFKDFANKKIDDIFDSLSGATVRKVQEPNTGILMNDKGTLRFEALPVEVQYSPIHGIEHFDYNADGLPDLLLAGNFFDVLPELGKYDANYGTVLVNQGKNKFKVIPPKQSGFFVKGQVRDMQKIKNKNGKDVFILAKNSDKIQVFTKN